MDWKDKEAELFAKEEKAGKGRRREEVPPRQATQADAGWRAGETPAAPPRQATPADAGWRAGETPAAPPRQATQADAGWRAGETPAAPPRQATQADAGWRAGEAPAAPPRQATQADAGWRAGEAPAAPVRQATVADMGWRNVEDMLDPGNVMNRATANAYARIEDFQAAVGQLSELVSSTETRYPVKRTLSKDGGESAILLCAAPDGRDVVAKVYYEPVNGAGSSISARTKVLEYMATEEGQKYTLAVSDIGLVELGGSRYYFEIMPYCKEGDLTHDKAFSFQEVVEIADYLNEALHSMHTAGILHRDIKPANLYRLNGRIVIGDFGVAKLAKAGVTRHTAGTDGYRAPESVLAVTAGESAFYFDEKSDYYSLGVTLGSLYEGHFVYDGMNAAMITVAVRQGRLPLTRTDPGREQLENLLNGLCRYDSRYRFGYEDVRRWVLDPNYTGGIVEDEWPKAFRMLNEDYRDEKSLFEGITKDAAHWDEGKELLYSKYFENFFISFRTDLARAAQLADENWRTSDRDKGLSEFLKVLFAPGPIVWRGYTFNGLQELADKMSSTQTPAAYGEILQKRCVSHWLANTEGIQTDAKTTALVDDIEKKSLQEPELACFWFGCSFAAHKTLRICGRTVSTVDDLLRVFFDTPRDFYLNGCYEKLMNRGEGANLYGFLYSFGFQDIIEAQWGAAANCDEFNKACILLGMLDTITVKSGADPGPLRRFFLQCGPIGIAVCVKRLIERGGDPVYQGLDADGKQIMAQIAGFRPAAAESVSELFRAYTPLVEMAGRFQALLADNPYCVSTGIYESRGVLCTNLVGCFAFRIFGRTAPLGFHAQIDSAQGGN